MIAQSDIPSNIESVKICCKCGGTFCGGFCKVCKSAYLKKYRAANKEKVYASEQAWRAANPDRNKATQDRYRATHKKEQLAYYQQNAQKIRDKSKTWYAANKQKAAAYKVEWHKNNPERRPDSKARRRSQIGVDRLPYGTIPALYKKQNGLCACCGEPLVKYHVDHIMPLALGGRHVPENLQLLLPVCNQRKSKKHPDVWRAELDSSKLQLAI